MIATTWICGCADPKLASLDYIYPTGAAMSEHEGTRRQASASASHFRCREDGDIEARSRKSAGEDLHFSQRDVQGPGFSSIRAVSCLHANIRSVAKWRLAKLKLLGRRPEITSGGLAIVQVGRQALHVAGQFVFDNVERVRIRMFTTDGSRDPTIAGKTQTI
ncbi:hypothetical protein ACEPAH_8785 [Sanghuangporus vaninii]